MARRIAALWLPRLLCELAKSGGEGRSTEKHPIGIVLGETEVAEEASEAAEASEGGVLGAVNGAAHKVGVRKGQTVLEARAIVAELTVRRVSRAAIEAALGRIAEMAMAFGPTVSISLGDEAPDAPPSDTVWVDLTGCTHLVGGEPAAACELAARVQSLGHAVRVAIAEGPRLSRAVALGAPSRETIVPPGQGARRLAELPLEVLPFERPLLTWFARLGVFSVGDLVRLPQGPTFDRLGRSARKILELALGRDDTPLVAYAPPHAPREAIGWDDDLVTSVEALEFAARGLVARLSARLEGRGEATSSISLELGYDRSIARFEKVGDSSSSSIDLPLPLWREEDLFRIVKSSLEQTKLAAPVRSLALVATQLVRAPKVQLGFGSQTAAASPEQLAVLVAELSSELGKDNVGLLEETQAHRPEARSRLRPALSALQGTLGKKAPSKRQAGGGAGASPLPGFWPSRVLAEPMLLEEGVTPGGLLSIDRRLFRIERIFPAMRLEQVEWWTSSPVNRDYVRVWLSGASADCEAWIFFDRARETSFLHGWYD